jgi:hypothetical protein
VYHEDERGQRPVPVVSKINAQEENPAELSTSAPAIRISLLKTIGPEVFHFLGGTTAGHARSTRRLRYAQLKAFYNFIINRCNFEMRNPCSASLVSKAFKGNKPFSRIPEDQGLRCVRKEVPA